MTAIIKKRVSGKMKVVYGPAPNFPFVPSRVPQGQILMKNYIREHFGAGYYHVFSMIGSPVYYFKGWIR